MNIKEDALSLPCVKEGKNWEKLKLEQVVDDIMSIFMIYEFG